MDAPPVQYVTTSDGYSIAYTVSGAGPTFVLVKANLYDTQQIWKYFPEWMGGLDSRFRVIQFDQRGGGMSTRGLPQDVTMADYVRDLDAIVERLRLERFVLAGFGGRGHIAVRFAAAHPEKVDTLILSACTLAGSAWMPVFFGMLPSENWNMFLRNNAPSGLSEAELRQRVEDFQRTVSLEGWNAWMHALARSDVASEVANLKMPTLVLHPRDMPVLPQQESMKLAATAPHGRFVLVDGDFVMGDAAQSLAAIDALLQDVAGHGVQAGRPSNPSIAPDLLSSREEEVLRLLAAGRSNQQIADELVISLNTVRRHVSNIFDKTGVANRTEAANFAYHHGLSDTQAAPDGLSLREVEVLRLIAAGKSNAQIADELVISQNTVIRHVSNIFAKIGAANRAQATAYAKDRGIV
jgi:DNA-binding NarL/FixJ family response regulator